MSVGIGSRGALRAQAAPEAPPPTEARLGLAFWLISAAAALADLIWPAASGFVLADPVTLTVVATGAAIGGTVLSTVGQIQASESAAQAQEANAAIAEQQAQIAREQAGEERHRAAIEAEIFSREARRRMGQRQSAIGASGITLSGSALNVLADAALADEQQRMFILHEGEQRAHARLVGASIEEATALEFQRQAAAERQAGGLRAAGTLIGGFAQTGLVASQSPTLGRAFAGGGRASALPARSPAGGFLNPATGMFGRV